MLRNGLLDSPSDSFNVVGSDTRTKLKAKRTPTQQAHHEPSTNTKPPQKTHPNKNSNMYHHTTHITRPGTLQHRHPATAHPKKTNIPQPPTAAQTPKVLQGQGSKKCIATQLVSSESLCC